ncbi:MULTISPECIES: PaaI family thioesterase [Mumia]|uniref:PaaI family thioesterase n=1 Tax=Mumia TaxID=1546255 RepID=UPI001423651E|nr:PaaI family thioesterase [Mumia sp. ZJ430]
MTDATTSEPGLGGVLGFSYDEVSGDRVVVTWTVGPEHLQPFGIVHGGVYCAVHESAASTAGQAWLRDKGIVVGVNNNTDFLRQAHAGDALRTVATPIHRGRTSQLWEISTTNVEGKLVSRGQVRLANLDGSPPAEFLAHLGGA